MTIKLTSSSYLAGLRQSGLLEPKDVERHLADLEKAGIDCTDSVSISEALVKKGILTEWQSEKLLQGRHKGFLLGRYRLLKLLGTGEMSAVYLAEHRVMERRCAVKVLPGNKVKDTSYLGRFLREAKAVASLNHPNIVRAYDVDQQVESGTEIHFLVMEYVPGVALDALVEEKGPLPFFDAADYIRQAADGLHHAHQAGLVHRDVKPGNFLLDSQGVVKLLDLGLARFFKGTEEESLTIKHDEKVLGTADYLAPEQAIDSHKVDHQADIYSLGCTMYFLLTGHPPFTDGTLVQRLLAHQTRQPQPVSAERKDIPPELEKILLKMMEKKTSDRFQSAADVSEAISDWLIENASLDWRRKHLSLVASLRGMENLGGGKKNTVSRESESSAQEPARSDSEGEGRPSNSPRGNRKEKQGRSAAKTFLPESNRSTSETAVSTRTKISSPSGSPGTSGSHVGGARMLASQLSAAMAEAGSDTSSATATITPVAAATLAPFASMSAPETAAVAAISSSPSEMPAAETMAQRKATSAAATLSLIEDQHKRTVLIGLLFAILAVLIVLGAYLFKDRLFGVAQADPSPHTFVSTQSEIKSQPEK